MAYLFCYFKTSPEIIKLAVWCYVRLPLSLRQVEDIVHDRGVDVCHETIRFWLNRFGPVFGNDLKFRATKPSIWKWHLTQPPDPDHSGVEAIRVSFC